MKKFIFGIVLLVIALIFTTTSIYYQLKEPTTEELELFLIVSNYSGFTVDTDKIHFGAINVNQVTGRTREINIKNPFDSRASVDFECVGDIIDYNLMPCPTERVFLDVGDDINISFSVGIHENTPMGNYSGRLIFLYRRVL